MIAALFCEVLYMTHILDYTIPVLDDYTIWYELCVGLCAAAFVWGYPTQLGVLITVARNGNSWTWSSRLRPVWESFYTTIICLCKIEYLTGNSSRLNKFCFQKYLESTTRILLHKALETGTNIVRNWVNATASFVYTQGVQTTPGTTLLSAVT